MDDTQPLRVLLVERPGTGGGIARHLLSNYDLDFSWARPASPQDLLELATEFKPNMVLCSDDTHGLIGALRLLCARPPIILVSSLRDAAPSPSKNLTDLPLGNSCAASMASPQSVDPRTVRDDTDGRLRTSFARILESSTNPAVMSDSDGWITFANASACRVLVGKSGSRVGTLLDKPWDDSCVPHWLDLPNHIRTSAPRRHRLALFDPGSGRPAPIHVDSLIGRLDARTGAKHRTFTLVSTHLGSARISDEACCFSLSGAAPIGPACEDEPQAPTYGSVVRISPHDYLLALPTPCSFVEAAFTAQRVVESLAATAAAPDEITEGVSRAPVTTSGANAPAHGVRLQAHSSLQVKSGESERASLELYLADALQRRALSVQYQPQYEVSTGRGCGVEALVRWGLASGETVSPSRFIPIAERSGMIHDLGAWVLRSACETAATWCSRTAPLSTLSVNVSALQIDEHFCNVLVRTLKHSGFPGNQLELEITESALIRNTERTIEYLKEWKRLGIRIAVDDFGTGYSSLSYLSRLPVDRLKLDQSLIHRMTLDTKGAAVTRSIVSLGAELGIDVIAEGVETEEQFQMLAGLGCPTVQGFLLGRPMSATQAQLVLRKTWGNRPARSYTGFPPSPATDAARHVH